MTQIAFAPTTKKIVSENYPYGYTLKTTKTDWLEYSPKKGFRHVSQTVNPKNGRLNAEKKGTYSPVQLMGTDENGHVKKWSSDMNGTEEWQRSLPVLAENFHLFTPGQIEKIYLHFIAMTKVTAYSHVVYCNSDQTKVLECLKPGVELAVAGAKSKGTENFFAQINEAIDYAGLEATQEPGYNPFTIRQYATV